MLSERTFILEKAKQKTHSMKTIMITISRGALIRNFLQTGIIKHLLDYGFRVVMLTPYYKDTALFQSFAHPNLVLEPLKTSRIRFRVFFEELSKAALFNKQVRFRYKYRVGGRPPSKFLYLLRLIIYTPLRLVPGFRRLVRAFDGAINPQHEHDSLFEKHKPDFVFLTSTDYTTDIAVLKSARRHGVANAMNPKSWDNVTRLLFPSKADYLFVWSNYMKKQAIALQDYRADQIIITGVPQFDFYCQESMRLSREQFCAWYGIDPKKKIILYASSGGDDLCDEMQFVSAIHRMIAGGTLPNAVVLVRPHLGYLQDSDRYRACEKYENCVLDRSAKQNSALRDRWDVSDDHVRILANSLFHADVCVNIASTMTLDAIAAGTEVVNLDYDSDPDVDPDYSVRRLHLVDYIKAVTGQGATWLVRSEDEFKRALVEILNRGAVKDHRAFTDEFLHINDGQSAKRVADEIARLASAEAPRNT